MRNLTVYAGYFKIFAPEFDESVLHRWQTRNEIKYVELPVSSRLCT